MAGRRSFGAIEKLASGRYRARYKVDGRWLNALTTFPSKAEAGIFLDSVRTDMVRGAWKAPPVVRMTVEEYGQKWIEQGRGSRRAPAPSTSLASASTLAPTSTTACSTT
jgi:hypothetical protein